MPSEFHINARANKQELQSRWMAFCQQFPTSESCLDFLFEVMKDNELIICRGSKCKSRALVRKPGARSCVCTQCQQETWFTSKTVFEYAKDIKAWLGTIWLMQQGVRISSSSLSAVIGVAPSTALNMLNKIRAVIFDCMSDEAIDVSSSLFANIIRKRSRETPARAHPRAELDQILEPADEGNQSLEQQNFRQNATSACLVQPRYDDCEGDYPRLTSTLGAFPELGGEEYVLSFLSERPIHSDKLLELTNLEVPMLSAVLSMLEVSELAERLPGDRFIRLDKRSYKLPSLELTMSTEMQTHVSAVVEYIRNNLHGCSLKDLQLYVADHWRISCPSRLSENRLLLSCLRRRLNMAELKTRSSCSVRLMPLAKVA